MNRTKNILKWTGVGVLAPVLITVAACSAAKTATTNTSSSASAAMANAQARENACNATGGTWNTQGNGSCIANANPVPATPTTVAPTTAAPTTPAMTVSEQQAVDSAQGYLSDGEGFSYNSLLGQLTSQYGGQFSQSDAKFAINYLHPDWDAQAVDAAKGYMQMGGFSRDSLIAQLTSSYGNGFTYDQAVYAANQVGL